ncbi:unnamed protein product, partial [Heterosigma akashiwo]
MMNNQYGQPPPPQGAPINMYGPGGDQMGGGQGQMGMGGPPPQQDYGTGSFAGAGG